MRLVRFDMWRGSHKIALSEILEVIQENSFDWRLLFLDASGSAWLGRLSIGKLAEEAREAPAGIPLTWTELKSFASGIIDLHDCLLAAAPPGLTLRGPEVRADDYSSIGILIEGFDSTTWTVGSADDGLLKGLSRRFEVTA